MLTFTMDKMNMRSSEAEMAQVILSLSNQFYDGQHFTSRAG